MRTAWSLRISPPGAIPPPRGRTQRHAVGPKVRVFVRNPDELANERAELARLLNKAGTCFLHEMSLSTASGPAPPLPEVGTPSEGEGCHWLWALQNDCPPCFLLVAW
jgi:hypothetical protein